MVVNFQLLSDIVQLFLQSILFWAVPRHEVPFFQLDHVLAILDISFHRARACGMGHLDRVELGYFEACLKFDDALHDSLLLLLQFQAILFLGD